MTTPIVTALADTRTDGPLLGDERAVLDHWLDLYRATLLLKLDGLDADQLCARPVPGCATSLLGLVRHLTEVEAYWALEVVHGLDVDAPYSSATDPDADLLDATPDTAAGDVERYRRTVDVTRERLAAWTDLDGPVAGTRRGVPLNLRWVLTHLVEEYARHLGHADIVREALDGRTGY